MKSFPIFIVLLLSILTFANCLGSGDDDPDEPNSFYDAVNVCSGTGSVDFMVDTMTFSTKVAYGEKDIGKHLRVELSDGISFKTQQNNTAIASLAVGGPSIDFMTCYLIGTSTSPSVFVTNNNLITSGAGAWYRIVNLNPEFHQLDVYDLSNNLLHQRVYEGDTTLTTGNPYYEFNHFDAGDLNVVVKNHADGSDVGRLDFTFQEGEIVTIYMYGFPGGGISSGGVWHED